jgi:two-component system, NtrC family, sensor kinase
LSVVKDIILIVDDRPANRYATAHALRRAGYEVREAQTGAEGLEFAKQIPSAILLDVKLPDIIGYEVCRRLKANPRTSHIPVLQLSAAFVDNESRVYALESGADAYLTQPVEPNVLVATVRSLVKLHEAESLAKLSANQWQATFDALSEGVAVFDQAGRIQRCNRAMVVLLGGSFAETEGKKLSELLDGNLVPFLHNDHCITVEEFNLGPRYFRVRIEPVILDEAPSGGILVLADITREKLAEQAALMNERLAATGRMANTIAHEINNPLASITNLLFLLRSPQTDAKAAAAYLASAENEVARVSRISRQILSFHRESAAPIHVDLGSLIDDVLALNNRALLEKELVVDREWTSEVLVEGFPAQLRQVFSNIVRNAIDASLTGGRIRIRVTPTVLMRDVKEPAARISVVDNGVGIPKKNLEKIFDAFFTTKELKGTGVGLWLSSTIVHEHRGQIQIRSSDEVGRSGTCISVLLPVNQDRGTVQTSALA